MSASYTIRLIDAVTAPARAAGAAVQSLAGYFKGLGASVMLSDKTLHKLKHTLREFGAETALENLGGILGEFGPLVKHAGAALLPLAGVAAGLALIYETGKHIFELSEVLEKLEVKLHAITGSSEETEHAMEGIKDTAKDLGVTIDKVGERFTDAMRQGFVQDDAGALVRLGKDLEALNPGKVQEVGEALDVLQKGLQRGQLPTKAFDALRKAGIPVDAIFDDIGKTSHKTGAAVRAEFEKGTGKIDDFAGSLRKVFLEAHGKEDFGDLFKEEHSKTLGGNIERIGSTIEQILLPAAQQLGPVITDLSKQFADWMSDPDTIASFQGVLAGLASGLRDLGKAADLLIGTWPRLGAVLGNLAVKAFGVGEPDLDAMKLGSAHEAALTRKAQESGQNISGGLADGILDGAPVTADAIRAVSNGVVDVGNDTLEIHSPSKRFAEQGAQIDAGLALGMDAHEDLAFSTAADVADGTVDAGQKALQAASSRADLVGDAGRAAGALMGSSTAGGGSTVYVGGITIQLGEKGDGSEELLTKLQSYLETDLASLLERHLESVGA